MIIVEEVANLRNRGYKAICLAGYNTKGYLPNWHRLSDNLENIDPQTLSRANRFTLALLREIDILAN
jgi:tRNA A37 methylthiotransferase MiaB